MARTLFSTGYEKDDITTDLERIYLLLPMLFIDLAPFRVVVSIPFVTRLPTRRNNAMHIGQNPQRCTIRHHVIAGAITFVTGTVSIYLPTGK